MSDKLIGVREASRRLGVHENTVRNWMASGTIQAAMRTSRSTKFTEAEVERVRQLLEAQAGRDEVARDLRDTAARAGKERVQTTVRFHRGRYRAVSEVAELIGTSREDAVHLLIGEGLSVLYARLGIQPDPAVHALELLKLVTGTWHADLSDDELSAFRITMAALERIAQVRARETEDG